MIGRRKIVTIGGLMLGLFAASTTSGLGETGDLTGADLDDICNAPVFDRNRDLWCNIYLRGYLEGLAIGAGLQKLGLSYCPPKNLTVRTYVLPAVGVTRHQFARRYARRVPLSDRGKD
jgi:hypothetical protein